MNQDFKEFLLSLTDSGARYLVVGGYAVAAHGHPRYTKDIDVWIDRTPENAARVLDALGRFGFGSLDILLEDIIREGRVIQLGVPPSRVDILTSVQGVEFEACWERRIELDAGGVLVPFIGLDDLKASKRAAGRLQDLADVEALG